MATNKQYTLMLLIGWLSLGIGIIMSLAYAAQMVNFKELPHVNKPNTYLACPKNYCNRTPDEISPTFNISEIALRSAWQLMISDQPRTTLLTESANANQLQYQQSSLIFRFTDDIDVLFIPLSQTTSTIAVYSRSQLGYYDFGVNKKRVQSWLSALNKIIQAE